LSNFALAGPLLHRIWDSRRNNGAASAQRPVEEAQRLVEEAQRLVEELIAEARQL